MTRTVFLHHFAHVLVQFLAVFGLGHVDEVDHDDSAHVPQAQLAGNLVGGEQVNVQCVTLLIGARARAVA